MVFPPLLLLLLLPLFDLPDRVQFLFRFLELVMQASSVLFIVLFCLLYLHSSDRQLLHRLLRPRLVLEESGPR